MTPAQTNSRQIEGRWEELVNRADQFAGRRVRITLLDDHSSDFGQNSDSLHQWIAEAALLKPDARENSGSESFADSLVEKYRNQGLVF